MKARQAFPAAAVADIDWRTPWLQPLASAGCAAAAKLASGACVHQALGGGTGFVTSEALPSGEAYEAFIARTGSVPTRDNLHDFFNGLIWQRYPLTKRRLNQMQAQALAARGVGPIRGALRDACTLFDESGAVLQAPAPLWHALLARDWQTLFITHRALWQQARLTVVGHAVLEQLVRPRKGITAQVLALPCPESLQPVAPTCGAGDAPEKIADIDRWISAELQLDVMRTKPFTPLPLLGIPGWCRENDALSFYDDPAVFRPRRLPDGR